MAEGIANLEAVIARLEQATADARAATREAHEATQAWRQAEKDARRVLAEVQAASKKRVDDLIGEAIAEGLAGYADTIQQATKQAHDHVQDQFDKLMNSCLYGNTQGRGVNIFDEMRARAKEMMVATDRRNLPRLK